MNDDYDAIVLSHHGCGTGWLRGIFRVLMRKGLVDLDISGGLAETKPPIGAGAFSVLLDVNAGAAARVEEKPATCVHFVCDPREALVETYFAKHTKQPSAVSALAGAEDKNDDALVEQGLLDLVKSFPMAQQLQGWTDTMWQHSRLVRAENLRSRFVQTLPSLLPILRNLPDILLQDLEGEVGSDTPAAKTFAPQPWQSYFTDQVSQAFLAQHGWLGPRLGYWQEPKTVQPARGKSGGSASKSRNRR